MAISAMTRDALNRAGGPNCIGEALRLVREETAEFTSGTISAGGPMFHVAMAYEQEEQIIEDLHELDYARRAVLRGIYHVIDGSPEKPTSMAELLSISDYLYGYFIDDVVELTAHPSASAYPKDSKHAAERFAHLVREFGKAWVDHYLDEKRKLGIDLWP